MPPKKKAKKEDTLLSPLRHHRWALVDKISPGAHWVSADNFQFTCIHLSVLYEEAGDETRAEAFRRAGSAVATRALNRYCLYIPTTEEQVDERYGNLKGVGRSSLAVFKELIRTGTCQRILDLQPDWDGLEDGTCGEPYILNDFLDVLAELSKLYKKQGDARRAKFFTTAKENLEKCDKTAILTSSKNYKNIKGVGQIYLDLMDEHINTGECARLEKLRTAQ
jgi:DNA polymerase/3'-5' exonuclease PolX